MDKSTLAAIKVGQKQAADILATRKNAKLIRKKAVALHAKKLKPSIVAALPGGVPITVGTIVAEGDSWFDYPLHDVLKNLEDIHGFDVESVAHKGDAIEQMAYDGHQLEDFTRCIEKLLRNNVTPKAILLSGGGNDVAGTGFAMLLNHAKSAVAGLNRQVVEGILNERIRSAYITILSAVTDICVKNVGKALPILVHGYDYPVPDGRGFLGGFGPLPGPWLEPGFREKGYKDLQDRITLTQAMIDRFNAMLKTVAALPPFEHVRYVDLRKTLSNGADYKKYWANELHPTPSGFNLVTDRFVEVLSKV